MSLISIENITLDFGGRIILNNASFNLNEGEKVGLVGSNGEGKSTLVDCIIGNKEVDKGRIIKAKNLTLGYLDQYTTLTKGKTILEVLKEAYQDLYDIENKLNEAYMKMGELEGEELDKLIEMTGNLQSILDSSDFYNIETNIGEVASGLGLMEIGLDKDVSSLSGGQRSKVLLTKLLLQNPNLLVLDEPTNFLDENQIAWLTNYLINYEHSFLIVSHDNSFLNKVCNVILHLEWGTLTRYKGNYDNFLSVYEIEKRNLEASYIRQQREIEKLEEFIAKNKARVATSNMAKSRQKVLDKMDRIVLGKEKVKPSFSFKEDRTPGKVCFKGNNLVLGYDEALTREMSFEFERNKKIALKGVNGIGKSTFLKTLIGLLKEYSGEVIRDPYIKVGYFQQEDYGTNKTPIDEIWDLYPSMTPNEIRGLLASSGLLNEQMMTVTKVLSGGEKAKVRLAKLMIEKYNVLVLDEPTNHLDSLAKESLKEALIKFKGTIILVSHDEEFYQDFVDQVINVEDFTLKII
ncbi:MAG: ABC-F family ATP-binding cassette domain-containing protein [Bacillales bacterium]|nr:ABC-F family ATP-binding cassette domain-containing protein [Bacillales bacterium]